MNLELNQNKKNTNVLANGLEIYDEKKSQNEKKNNK